MAKVLRFQKDDAASQQQKIDELFAQADQFLQQYPLRYAQAQNRYLLPCNGRWEMVTPESMPHRFSEFTDAAFRTAVSVRMEEKGWKYTTVTYSFQPQPPDIFNMVVRDTWAQFDEEPPHWFFDVLIQSLGGDKAENVEHLEKVVVHKFMFPACAILPCVLFHGEGGTGKNWLVDYVLATAFGGATWSGKATFVLGDFNNIIAGKACVLINEADDDKIAAKAEDLKDLLHKGKVTLNPKHVNPYEADNTPLYFISSNDPVGGLRLDRTDADRRYSVSRSEDDQTLLYWLCQRHPAWTKAEARAWLTTEGLRVSRDKKEVGRWLWHLALKHNPSEAAPPEALHGADFADLFAVQQKIDEALCEAVFLEKDENGESAFTHIQLGDLERGYAALGGKLSVKKFREKVNRWLKKHAPHIGQKRIDYQTPSRRLARQVYRNTCVADLTWKVLNTDKYLEKDGYKDLWCGPLV